MQASTKHAPPARDLHAVGPRPLTPGKLIDSYRALTPYLQSLFLGSDRRIFERLPRSRIRIPTETHWASPPRVDTHGARRGADSTFPGTGPPVRKRRRSVPDGGVNHTDTFASVTPLLLVDPFPWIASTEAAL